MPSADPFADWWSGIYFSRAANDAANHRPCGCYADAVVFGHYHPAGDRNG